MAIIELKFQNCVWRNSNVVNGLSEGCFVKGIYVKYLRAEFTQMIFA